MGFALEKYCTVEDFYNMPEDIRAELIDGEIVYRTSPSRIHQEILGELFNLIKNYMKSQKGSCHVYPAPFGVQLDEKEDTVLEPDISVICDPNKLNDRGCLGAPDWIIEIASPSNSKQDYITNWNSDKTLFIAFNNCYILSSKSPQTLENAKFIASEFALRLSLVLYPFPSCYELS